MRPSSSSPRKCTVAITNPNRKASSEIIPASCERFADSDLNQLNLSEFETFSEPVSGCFLYQSMIIWSADHVI
jgi:hypothetical protein